MFVIIWGRNVANRIDTVDMGKAAGGRCQYYRVVVATVAVVDSNKVRVKEAEGVAT